MLSACITISERAFWLQKRHCKDAEISEILSYFGNSHCHQRFESVTNKKQTNTCTFLLASVTIMKRQNNNTACRNIIWNLSSAKFEFKNLSEENIKII